MTMDIEGQGYRPLRAWIIVVLLCLLYVTSFVDRIILALLADPVAQSLSISDTQVGLMVGIGFAALYVLIGLPIAHVVDMGYRRRVLLAGVGLWSLSTISSGFVESYGGLFVARAGVAIGEAALTPVAISLISEMFSWKRRALPTSVYMATGVLMGSGAFIVGGGAIEVAGQLTAYFDLETWRLTFVIVGIPGLLLVPFVTVLVKGSRGSEGREKNERSVSGALVYLKLHARIYLPVFAGVGIINALAMGAIVWLPTVLVRTHDLGLAEAGMMFGMFGSPAAAIGTILGPCLVQLLQRNGVQTAIPLVLSGAALVAAVVLAMTVASAHLSVVMMGLVFGMTAIAVMTVMPPIVIQLYAPLDMKARLMALNLLFLNLLGMGSGPVIVASLSDYGVVSSLGQAIQLVAIVSGVISFALFLYSRRAFIGLLPEKDLPLRPQ